MEHGELRALIGEEETETVQIGWSGRSVLRRERKGGVDWRHVWKVN